MTVEDNNVPRDAWLVTIDVETLYSFISHDLGIQAVGQLLKARDRSQWVYNEFILQSLKLVLHNNAFTFDDKIFLQTQGVTMGTPCAPSYANLYLAWWERQLFADDSLSM